jgi:ketosteroid isomerase-like protein
MAAAVIEVAGAARPRVAWPNDLTDREVGILRFTTRGMTNTIQTHTQSVTAMYDAFGRGDVTEILSHLSEEVTWDVTDEAWTPHPAKVPWLAPRRGHEQVAEFFAIVSAWHYERFEVLDMLVSDTQVAAEIRLTAALPNGGRIDEEVIHLWTFGADGKIVKLRRMLDTAANIEAARA